MKEFTTKTVRTSILLGLQSPSMNQDLADKVLANMGMSASEVGVTRAGTPRYRSVVSNALSEMASDDLVQEKSGVWSLTSRGQQIASWCQATGKREIEAVFQAQRLTFWSPPHIPEPFDPDPDITATAFAQQPCAGKYNPLEPTCNSPLSPCPFVGQCAILTAEKFALMYLPVEVKPAFQLHHSSHEVKVSKFAVICNHCSTLIPANSTVVTIPARGTVHKDCYEEFWKVRK